MLRVERQRAVAFRFVDTFWLDCGYVAGNVAPKREHWMKLALVVLTLCACTQGALAAGPNCRAIESTSGRLACYDAAFPPLKMEKPAAVENDVSRSAYKDPFVEEDARTRARLKNICRGC
jgi:hypothetical protein